MFGSKRKVKVHSGQTLGMAVARGLMAAIGHVAATPNSPMLCTDPRVNAKRERKANRPAWRQ